MKSLLWLFFGLHMVVNMVFGIPLWLTKKALDEDDDDLVIRNEMHGSYRGYCDAITRDAEFLQNMFECMDEKIPNLKYGSIKECFQPTEETSPHLLDRVKSFCDKKHTEEEQNNVAKCLDVKMSAAEQALIDFGTIEYFRVVEECSDEMEKKKKKPE